MPPAIHSTITASAVARELRPPARPRARCGSRPTSARERRPGGRAHEARGGSRARRCHARPESGAVRCAALSSSCMGHLDSVNQLELGLHSNRPEQVRQPCRRWALRPRRIAQGRLGHLRARRRTAPARAGARTHGRRPRPRRAQHRRCRQRRPGHRRDQPFDVRLSVEDEEADLRVQRRADVR